MRGAKEHAIRRLLVLTTSLGTLAAMTLGIAGCDDRLARMEENQVRLQAMVAANAREIATVSSQVYVNNNEVQASLQKLDRNDAGLAAGVATVQTKEDAIQESVTTASQTLNKRMTALDENQQRLQDGVAQVADVTRKTASDVTSVAKEQTDLHQTVRDSRKELGDSISVVAVNQEKTRTDIGQLQQTDQRIVEQTAALAASQDKLHASLAGMDKLMQTVSGDVTAVARGQAALHQTINEHHTALTNQAGVLEQNQRTMQTSVDGIAGQTNRTVEGIAAVAAQQNTMQQTLGANHKALTTQVATVIEHQQTLQAGLRDLSDKAGQAGAQLTAMAAGQQAIGESLKNGNEAVTARLTGLSENQTGLKGDINGLNQKTDTVVNGVHSIRTEQATLRDSLAANHETTKSMVTQLSGGQQKVQDQLDVLTSMTGQAEIDILALTDSSLALRQAIQSAATGLNVRADKINAGLDGMAATNNVAYKALREQADHLSGQMAASAENQQRLQGDIDTIVATTGQTALDVIGVADSQNATRQAIQSHAQAADRQLANLAAGQEREQNTLDAVTATAGQTAMDVLTLNEDQARAMQAAHADRQSLAARLTSLVESQQQWTQRFEAVQANAQTMTAAIATLEQRVATLQGALQPGIDGLATRLDANGQSRAQFETKVNQEIQTLLDAISQLRQDQVSFADQMQQIQKRTQNQTKDIIEAIQQLKQPPAEMKVSESTPAVSEPAATVSQPTTELESSVAEAAAK